MRRNVRAQGAAVVVVSAILLFTGCSKESGEKEPVVSVQVAPAVKTTLQQTVNAEGVLYPLQQSALVPKISAPVKRFYVNRGSRVREGELVAVLENRDLAAASQDNKGAFEQAQAAYQTTTAADLPQELQKAQLDFNAAKTALEAEEKVYNSRQQLYKEGALPRKELDQSAVDVTNARNAFNMAQQHLQAMQVVGKQQTLKAAAGQLESAKGKYLGAEAQLSYSQIRSPINGVVTDRPLYPGEMATAGTPLMTIMNISQVIARAHIPQADAALLKVGDSASVAAPGVDKPFDGKVTVVSPALDPGSTTVEIWVQADNPGQQLKPGTSVEVSIVARTLPNAIVVPAAAVLTSAEGETSVMVAGSDGRAHEKAVKTGIKQGDQVQVVEGLQPAENVVTTGAYGLSENTKIKIETAQAPGTEPPASGSKKEAKSDEK